jgi:hypothetical protein
MERAKEVIDAVIQVTRAELIHKGRQ